MRYLDSLPLSLRNVNSKVLYEARELLDSIKHVMRKCQLEKLQNVLGVIECIALLNNGFLETRLSKNVKQKQPKEELFVKCKIVQIHFHLPS